MVDIGKFVPNLNVTTFSAGHTSSANPFIRGIGIQDHLITTDPGVGVYVDGVYLGRRLLRQQHRTETDQARVTNRSSGLALTAEWALGERLSAKVLASTRRSRYQAYTAPGDTWTAALYGRNVADVRYDNARLNTGDYILQILSNDASEFGVRLEWRL